MIDCKGDRAPLLRALAQRHASSAGIVQRVIVATAPLLADQLQSEAVSVIGWLLVNLERIRRVVEGTAAELLVRLETDCVIAATDLREARPDVVACLGFQFAGGLLELLRRSARILGQIQK